MGEGNVSDSFGKISEEQSVAAVVTKLTSRSHEARYQLKDVDNNEDEKREGDERRRRWKRIEECLIHGISRAALY